MISSSLSSWLFVIDERGASECILERNFGCQQMFCEDKQFEKEFI